jgi:hypothetical protein
MALILSPGFRNRGVDFNSGAIGSVPWHGLRHDDRNPAGICSVEDQLPQVGASRNGGQFEHLRLGKYSGMEPDRHHLPAGDAQFYGGAQWAVRDAARSAAAQAGVYKGVNNKFTG